MELLLAFTVLPAYLVASFFLKHDPGPEEPQAAVNGAIGFGILSIFLAIGFGLLIELVISGDALARVSGADSSTDLPLFIDVMIFATIEEIVKFIPLTIFIWKKPYFNEITDGIIYFSIVGLTFGAIESFLYGLSGGELAFAIALMRLALGLFFHGALTGVVGYYLAKAKVTTQGFVMVPVVLIVVSLIHTLYNYFVYSVQGEPALIFGAAMMAISVNGALFWLYFEAMKQDMKLGLAGPHFAQEREARRQQHIAAQRQHWFHAQQQQQAAHQQGVQPQPHQPSSEQHPPAQNSDPPV